MNIVAQQLLTDRDRDQQIAALDDLFGDVEPVQLPLVCGQCEHFRVNRRDASRGYCKLLREYSAGDALSMVHPDRNASSFACPKIKVNCEF